MGQRLDCDQSHPAVAVISNRKREVFLMRGLVV